jgi:hypothetical protein
VKSYGTIFLLIMEQNRSELARKTHLNTLRTQYQLKHIFCLSHAQLFFIYLLLTNGRVPQPQLLPLSSIHDH